MHFSTYLSEFKNLSSKIKWIVSQSKSALIFLIFNTIVTSALSLLSVYNAIVSKSLIDAAISRDTPTVIHWLIIMLSIFLIRFIVWPITSFLTSHTTMTFTQSMQARLYEHVIHSDWLEESKFHSVNLLTRITSDVNSITTTLLGTIPNIISLTLTLIASLSTLIYFAPSIAIAAIFIGPLLVIISRIFSKKLKAVYKQIQDEDVKYRSFIQESFQMLTIVKTFCMEEFNLSKLKLIQKNKYYLAMKNTKYNVYSSMSASFCSSIAYFIIFCWGILNISNGFGTYGTFTAMLQLYDNIQGPFSSLAGTLPSLINAIAAAERLMELESIPIENQKQIDCHYNETPSINFKDVCFSYNQNAPVLNHVNLTIEPGETIAFIGPSGQGKTTLIRLFLSLLQPTQGQILMQDSIHTVPLSAAHRSLISYVPQGNTLFSGTIKENIQYGKMDATLEEIMHAADASCASSFISKLENHLDTVIGENGTGISEGQAQRLAISRALIQQKPILILDEATSSLDCETELQVINSIKNLTYQPTCIIITHRPSALNICDRIYKLENNTINEITLNGNLDDAVI